MREHLRGTHTGRCERLLNALLDISRLEFGEIEAQPTDFAVATLFEALNRDFGGLAASKGLELEVESTNACVHSDPALIGEVLHQLVSNAIAYTRDGRVRMRCLPGAERVRIDVNDTGIGIPAEQLPYICDPFYQASDGVGAGEGYGLGLSIVQRTVRLLDVRLEVRSEVGRGSTFSLLLPRGVC